MRNQLCFFTDFDVQKLEPTFLEIVYHTKHLRFTFPANANLRKFSVKLLGKVQVTLPEVIQQYEHDGQCDEPIKLHVVDFCAEFVDMGKCVDFLAKLGNIGEYRQLITPICNASLPAKEEDPCEDDFERDESEVDTNVQVDLSMLPRLSLFDDYTYRNVTPQFFEVTVTGDTFRFVHPPRTQREIRLTRKGLPQIPGDKAGNLIIPGVMLQGDHPRRGWVDAYKVDLYMEFAADTADTNYGALISELHAQGYVRK